MPCCGRPSNRNQKSGPKAYYERYAYLSAAQKAKRDALVGTKCATCDALTFNNENGSCSVCGNPKVSQEK